MKKVVENSLYCYQEQYFIQLQRYFMEQPLILRSLLLSDQGTQQLSKINQPIGLVFPKVHDDYRKIQLGTPNKQFANNQIDTTKYNLLTFLPKSLLLQFTRLSNVIFLLNAFLQAIPIISSLSPFSAIGPLAFVLAISMLREGYQDYKRHRKDWQINSRKTRVLRNQIFVQIEWDQLKTGDYVKILNHEIAPADILLLYSSDQNSVCYVQTANLDGQNNLKQKHAFSQTSKMNPNEFQGLKAHCQIQSPKSLLYQFQGEFKFQNQDIYPIGYQNLILRQTTLRNTDQVVGVALYCGYDTKILKNQGQVHHKVSRMQKKLNYIQIALLILLLVMCGSCGLGYYFIHKQNNLRQQKSYIPNVNLSLLVQSSLTMLTVFLLLNFLIPITLNILIEGIKTFSGLFLAEDFKLIDKQSNKACLVFNTSIVEELGSVDIVLTDKTGTLTSNEMVFKTIAIQDRVYSKEFIEQNISNLRKDQQFEQFWIGLIICHDVVKDHHKDIYQGSSPDEVCFVNFAHTIGYSFIKRTKNTIEIKVQGERQVYVLIDMINFTSRKRMSVVVQNINNKDEVIVYTKGADTTMFQKSSWYQHSQGFTQHIDGFAKNGLRTLVFAKKIMTLENYCKFGIRKQQIWNQLKQKIIEKEQCIRLQNEITQQIQDRLTITGATGIEDRLQEDVPQTIARLQRAGIRVMMITGDKLQTAENIGYLSHMIKQHYKVYKLSSLIADIRTKVQDILRQIQDHSQICIIIEGKQIANILEQKDQRFINIYTSIFDKSKSVIFCRSSPKQKASIVRFIKKNMKAVVLAIGDGGNDVGMIEEAHVGVGIIGKEGNSASVVSDFSFGKFKFLDRLILHHGRWFVYRLSYFFVCFGLKNMVITWIIFLFAMQSAYSGSFNYTSLFYSMYNCFIAISQLVNYGLYGQDINDDQHPIIWEYLPEIYKQIKNKNLFSYKRYLVWTIISIVSGGCLYFMMRTSLSSVVACDAEGRIADFQTNKIGNEVVLSIFLLVINYMDTETHTSFFIVFVFVIMTAIPTAGYFIFQNYLPFRSYYLVYTDNLNARFWLTISAVVAATYLVKLGQACYQFQSNPSIIDTYKKLMGEPAAQIIEKMNQLTGRPKDTQSSDELIRQVMIQQDQPLDLLINSSPLMNRKLSSSLEVTSQSFIPAQVINKSAVTSIGYSFV